MSLEELKADLKYLSNPSKARLLQGFFKTGKGQYGEGDVFLGVTVPSTRKVAIKHQLLALKEVESLLDSNIHEERLCALLLLVHNFEKHEEKRKEIFDFYIKNTKRVNNWDLVDLSAPRILGHYLSDKDKSILYELAKSSDLWEKRISIISTLYFIIKDNQFADTLNISSILLSDKHDLIHKAVGWMLREVGKKDVAVLKSFLKKHYKHMPRTMLRYSIEKFPKKLRKSYLDGSI